MLLNVLRFGLLLSLFPFIASANTGRVLKLNGGNDSYLIRGNQRMTLKNEMKILEGDKVFSTKGQILLLLHPSSQVSMSKLSGLKVGPIVELLKGMVRAKVIQMENQEAKLTVSSTDVTFVAQEAEFEINLKKELVDLDVMEGEVEVSSPHVHTFVPEIVKRNEGFRYLRSKMKYLRREFKAKFSNHPTFLSEDELKEFLEKKGK